MSDSRIRSLPEDCALEERQRKRSRGVARVDSVENVSELFNPHLHQVRREGSERVSTTILSQNAQNKTEKSSPVAVIASDTEKHHTAPQHELSVSAGSQTTYLYIYQRQEYDEGMFVYPDDVSLEQDTPESFRSAAVLYNTGQSHLRSLRSQFKKSPCADGVHHCNNNNNNKYFAAKKWFELASLRLELDGLSAGASTLSVRIYHNLGYCHYRLGNNEEAMKCYKTALVHVQEASLGEMDEAATANCIGVLYFHQEPADSTESLQFFESCLTVYKKTLADDSAKLATLLNNIGRVHYLNGDYPKALAVYERALVIRRAKLGKQSVDVAATICNTGQTHHQRGEFDLAMEYYREFLQMANSHLGSNHRDVAIIIKCMAEIHHERREMTKARDLYLEALKAARVSLGSSHPDLASTLNKLGNLHYEMNDYELSLKYYLEGLNIEETVLDAYHPHLLVTLMNVAQVFRHRGDFRAALTHYTDVHARTAKVYGPNSLECANTLSNMALMKYQLKGHEAAFELYQEALRIQRDFYGSDENTDVASSLNSIGLVLFQQGIHDLAKACFYDSLRIRRKLLGPDHRDVSILWYNIATIHLESGDEALAIRHYKETLRIERAVLGATHQDCVLTLQHLGLVHQQRGELEEALVFFGEALKIEKVKGAEKQYAAAKLLNLMGNIHLQTANVEEMNACYAEASRIYSKCGLSQDSLVIAGYNFYGLSKLHPQSAATA